MGTVGDSVEAVEAVEVVIYTGTGTMGDSTGVVTNTGEPVGDIIREDEIRALEVAPGEVHHVLGPHKVITSVLGPQKFITRTSREISSQFSRRISSQSSSRGVLWG